MHLQRVRKPVDPITAQCIPVFNSSIPQWLRKKWCLCLKGANRLPTDTLENLHLGGIQRKCITWVKHCWEIFFFFFFFWGGGCLGAKCANVECDSYANPYHRRGGHLFQRVVIHQDSTKYDVRTLLSFKDPWAYRS